VTLNDLETILQKVYPLGSITVEGDLYHVQITIADNSFVGLSRLKREQAVYQHLQPYISSGVLHAVTLKTLVQE
jgi:acid stress-induced BolA-like protein IbaG/YrbA